MGRKDTGMTLGEAALKGAVASLVGGLVMKVLWDAGQRTLLPPERRVTSPTTEVVEQAAARHDVALSPGQTRAAAATFYHGNMAIWGAIFGIGQSRLHPPDALHGLLLGGLVYAANFSPAGVLPMMGIVPPPGEQPTRDALVPVLPHVAYGLTTAAVFKALA